VPLSADGLKITSPEKLVYEGWKYPEEWVVESYSQEGPKILQHGGWYHMVLAVGGTAGPPTSHMVICARSRSIHGPWEHHPRNPILKTNHAAERWWSKGHGTIVQGPNGKDWYMLYHGYEAGYHSLGRQTLMMPMRYTNDGWFEAAHAHESDPLPSPTGGQKLPHGMPLSDAFKGPHLGPQWSFFRGGAQELNRVKVESGTLHLTASGTSPQNSSPLCIIAGDPAYEVEVDLSFDAGVQAGVLLFYSERLYAGVGVNEKAMMLHRYGLDQRPLVKPEGMQRSLKIRMSNRWHVLTLHTSHDDGKTWVKFPIQMDVSGYHHNVAYGFMSLRPALYASGQGTAQFKNFQYRAL
jgi:beta-xylosidase